MKRVAIWNGGPVPEELGGGTRGNTVFKPTFDLALLSEEVKEFYQALANQDLVEMIDALCDMKFVFEGIQFKFGMISYSYEASNLNAFYENDKAMVAIVDYFSHHKRVATELIENELLKVKPSEFGLIFDTLEAAYDIVCTANEQKGTAKNGNGKTMKGPNWVNPAASIYQLLIEKGFINDDNSVQG